MTESELRLYVWEDVLCDWTCGIMFALADSVEHARELIIAQEGKGGMAEKQMECEPDVYTAPVGFAIWGGS